MATITYLPATADAAGRLWTRTPHGPLGALLRFRLSRRQHTALVLTDGEHRAVSEPGGRIPLLRTAFGGYTEAYLVDTAPRTGSWRMPVGTEPVALEITWWVADPARAVVTGNRPADPWAAVSHHLDRLIEDTATRGDATGQDLTPQYVLELLSQPRVLENSGLACCASGTRSADVLAGAGEDRGAPPLLWSPQRREEYEFYLQAVRTGPDALVALWLLRHPDEVRQVLEWVTAHPRTAPHDGGYDPTLSALLERLSEEEHTQLAKATAERIRVMTAPEGDL
ncbi:hypothetical protein ACFY2W_35630 [Streptomyces sp. NPDC001262]|uniref:hypothetical protein n=1 Tax=Streptomyces TaxID=1883 RepID=UPI0036A6BA59